MKVWSLRLLETELTKSARWTKYRAKLQNKFTLESGSIAKRTCTKIKLFSRDLRMSYKY